MATPTQKDPVIETVLNMISGTDRRQMITDDKCTWCKKPATEFRDDLSRKEYTISGFCQQCQDDTFGE